MISARRGEAPVSAPLADPRPDHQSAALPHLARIRVQRVRERRCAGCGGPVLRARRGPAPRQCVACEIGTRRLRQLRAYLRSAERLADALGRADVAVAARAAVAILDAGPRS